MNAPIDTLAFAERFEGAGFGHDQARALAAAFGQAQDSTREGLVTKDYLDARLAEFEGRLNGEVSGVKGEVSAVRVEVSAVKVELMREMAALEGRVNGEVSAVKGEVSAMRVELMRELAALEGRVNGELSGVKGELSAMKVELVREIAGIGKDVSGRLWSTITIVAGVATAISAAISAGVALLLKAGGL